MMRAAADAQNENDGWNQPLALTNPCQSQKPLQQNLTDRFGGVFRTKSIRGSIIQESTVFWLGRSGFLL
jgi:hypothetical protein